MSANIVDNSVSTSASLKIPVWVWPVVVIVSVLVIGAAVAIPLLLLHPKNVTPNVTPSASPSITRPILPNVNSGAITFQTVNPETDNLTKYSIIITEVQNASVGYILNGQNSKSSFFVTDVSNGSTQLCAILINADTTTTGASTFGVKTVASVNSSTWYSCISSVVNRSTVCTPISISSINNEYFVGSSSKSGTMSLMSFSSSRQLSILQDGKSNCTTAILPSLTSESIALSMFGSNEQSNPTFGLVQPTSNNVTYFSDCNDVNTISVDVNERVLFADMTYDGKYILVLTSDRLVLYQNDKTELGSFYINSQYTPTNCSIDHQHNEKDESLWCVIGVSQNYSLIIPFVTNSFDVQQGFQVPLLSALSNSSGPSAIHFMVDQKILFLIQADTIGNVSSVALNVTKL